MKRVRPKPGCPSSSLSQNFTSESERECNIYRLLYRSLSERGNCQSITAQATFTDRAAAARSYLRLQSRPRLEPQWPLTTVTESIYLTHVVAPQTPASCRRLADRRRISRRIVDATCREVSLELARQLSLGFVECCIVVGADFG